MLNGVTIARAIWIWFETCGKGAKCKVPKCGKKYSMKGGTRGYRLMVNHVYDNHNGHDILIDSFPPPVDKNHAKAIKVYENEAQRA
jgi:hypothetical protein